MKFTTHSITCYSIAQFSFSDYLSLPIFKILLLTTYLLATILISRGNNLLPKDACKQRLFDLRLLFAKPSLVTHLLMMWWLSLRELGKKKVGIEKGMHFFEKLNAIPIIFVNQNQLLVYNFHLLPSTYLLLKKLPLRISK